jgi:hypothetical protein
MPGDWARRKNAIPCPPRRLHKACRFCKGQLTIAAKLLNSSMIQENSENLNLTIFIALLLPALAELAPDRIHP